MTVLLAGATGTLGRHLLTELEQREEHVRALVRSPARAQTPAQPHVELAIADLADPEADLDGACRGVRTVISAAGRSCSTRRLPERGGFRAVDCEGNRRLLQAAVRAGAERFLYVSILGAQRLRGLEYVDAHEEFVELLQGSPIRGTVVRANGFFAGYLELLDLVTSPGPATLIGSGAAKDNPIHEADLAVACLDALAGEERELEIGGPETFSRREELELAREIAGRRSRIVRVSPRLLNAGATVMQPFDTRRAGVIKFLSAICVTDMVGPPTGHRRLGDYLNAAVAGAHPPGAVPRAK
jgi:uncharacterized protein YbjT (DUF2867 family)